MTVSISGLASGLNWQNIVNELIAAQEVPVTAMQTQETTNSNQLSDLTTLEADLNGLQSSAAALGAAGTFSQESATFADSTTSWLATAASGTALGQYTFNVTQLATAAALHGADNVGAPLSATSDVSGVTVGTMSTETPVTAGTFTVNGVQINVAATDSLQDVFNNIETATAAAGDAVTGSYDPTTDTVSLKSASGNIVLGSTTDTSNILSTLKLYTPEKGGSTATSEGRLGASDLSAPVTGANLKIPVTGAGSMEINGVSISYQATDSLQTILNNINHSNAGVIAAYNPTTDQFTLTNNATGNMSLTASDTGGGDLLQAMGLTTTATAQAGANCEFSVNGGPSLTSTSNTLDDGATGITGLSVTATTLTTGSNSPQTVTVAPDTSNATTAINNFITSFNNIQGYISAETAITQSTNGKVATSDLSSYGDISQMQSDLENLVFGAVPGLSGSIQRLDNIGIGFIGTSPDLSILDQGALTDALTNNPSAVDALFNSSGGLVSQIDNYVTNATGPTGSITTDMSTLNTSNKDLANQITQMQTQISSNQTAMTNEYIAMETAMSKMQTEESSLNAILNSTSSSSSSSSSGSSSSSANMNMGNDNVSVS